MRKVLTQCFRTSQRSLIKRLEEGRWRGGLGGLEDFLRKFRQIWFRLNEHLETLRLYSNLLDCMDGPITRTS